MLTACILTEHQRAARASVDQVQGSLQTFRWFLTPIEGCRFGMIMSGQVRGILLRTRCCRVLRNARSHAPNHGYSHLSGIDSPTIERTLIRMDSPPGSRNTAIFIRLILLIMTLQRSLIITTIAGIAARRLCSIAATNFLSAGYWSRWIKPDAAKAI